MFNSIDSDQGFFPPESKIFSNGWPTKNRDLGDNRDDLNNKLVVKYFFKICIEIKCRKQMVL
jgi:hypothetical protein